MSDEHRARAEFARRMRGRRMKAAGIAIMPPFGSAGKYLIPKRETVLKGVERRRAMGVKVTLPKLNLPELGDET